ncbi:Uncharacterised protein [Mycobacteroides abscessus subsp. abscessus]|nr:Uncharacterised protein [Mycobacteroides abscessus subsp. abscessus]
MFFQGDHCCSLGLSQEVPGLQELYGFFHFIVVKGLSVIGIKRDAQKFIDPVELF